MWSKSATLRALVLLAFLTLGVCSLGAGTTDRRALEGAPGQEKEDSKNAWMDSRRPASGKALVYLMQAEGAGGAIVRDTVSLLVMADGLPLGELWNKYVIAFEGDPGRHEFVAMAQNAAFLDANLGPDRIYYVLVTPKAGFYDLIANFEVVLDGSEAMTRFLKAKPKLKLVKSTALSMRRYKSQAARDKKIAKCRELGTYGQKMAAEEGYEAPLMGH